MQTEVNEKLKLLFSKTETAAAIGVSPRKIDYLIRDNQLHATRIGRRTLIHRREIERLARQGAA